MTIDRSRRSHLCTCRPAGGRIILYAFGYLAIDSRKQSYQQFNKVLTLSGTLVGLHPYRMTDHSILDIKVTRYAAYPTSGTLRSASCLNLSPNSSNLLR